MQIIARLIAISTLTGVSGFAAAGAQDPIGELLTREHAPPGVVFEIVSWDETALVSRMPSVARHAIRLRTRFPGLAIAVVTHGAEQFSLLATRRRDYSELHALVESFESERQIAVHACANHASWRDKAQADFPDYVDVTSSAAGRLDEYRALGFVIIQL